MATLLLLVTAAAGAAASDLDGAEVRCREYPDANDDDPRRFVAFRVPHQTEETPGAHGGLGDRAAGVGPVDGTLTIAATGAGILPWELVVAGGERGGDLVAQGTYVMGAEPGNVLFQGDVPDAALCLQSRPTGPSAFAYSVHFSAEDDEAGDPPADVPETCVRVGDPGDGPEPVGIEACVGE